MDTYSFSIVTKNSREQSQWALVSSLQRMNSECSKESWKTRSRALAERWSCLDELSLSARRYKAGAPTAPTQTLFSHTPHILGTRLLNQNYLNGLNANLAWAIRPSFLAVSGGPLQYPQHQHGRRHERRRPAQQRPPAATERGTGAVPAELECPRKYSPGFPPARYRPSTPS